MAGPADREHFFAAQARNRRATWRLTGLCLLCVGLMGIPMSAVVTPLFGVTVVLLIDLVNLVVPIPDLLSFVGVAIVHASSPAAGWCGARPGQPLGQRWRDLGRQLGHIALPHRPPLGVGAARSGTVGDDIGLLSFDAPMARRMTRLRRQGATVDLAVAPYQMSILARICVTLIVVLVGALLMGCALIMTWVALIMDMLLLAPVFVVVHAMLRGWLGG